MKSRRLFATRTCWIPAAVLLAGALNVFAGGIVTDSPTSATASPLTQLAWASDHLVKATKPGDLTVDFTFSFTNISDTEVVIDPVKPSCSCTTAKLPHLPWH